MGPETKTCQNCKNEFIIEPEDFDFYARMKVPAPTFCPECRFQRRLMFRNAMKLYKRTCGLCSKNILSWISADKPFIVYCNPCYWSSKWDELSYGREYDPSRGFFEQFKDFLGSVPWPALSVDYPTLVNSEFVNAAGHLKDCYLLFDADYNERSFYSVSIKHCADVMDSYLVGGSELCFQNIDSARNNRLFFSEDSEDCHDVYFSRDMSGCSDCFGCAGLRRQQYHIFNKPYSKEDYFKKLAEFKLSSHSELEKIKKEVRAFWLAYPQKYMHSLQNVNSSGEYVYYSKNTRDSYVVIGAEDSRFCQFLDIGPVKDSWDYSYWGNNAQNIYECQDVGEGINSLRFVYGCLGGLDIEYSMFCWSSQHVFGCAGLGKHSYCILNKKYSKGDYEKLRAGIIEDMNKNPYTDSKGRVFRYGEFFPYDFSLFAYNESDAQLFFSLSPSEAESKGWRWREEDLPAYKITKPAMELPDDIGDVKDDVLKEILGCASCGRGYRLIPAELGLLRNWGFALPRMCFECRHRERLGRVNLPKFYERRCVLCEKEVISSYSPEKPDILYCEECYNREVG